MGLEKAWKGLQGDDGFLATLPYSVSLSMPRIRWTTSEAHTRRGGRKGPRSITMNNRCQVVDRKLNPSR